MNLPAPFRRLALPLLAALIACLAGSAPSRAEEVAPKKPPLPKVLSLSVQPATLTLDNLRDARSVIITGHTQAGYDIDLSPRAKIQPASGMVRIGKDGYIYPVKAGKTSLIVTAAGQRATVPVTVKSVANPPISFVREVMPILSKSGCNAGTCHGSAKGKNGFKLSLRGYDPDYDYHALIADVSGRRFNRADASQSLMLLKPTGTVPHRGGVLFTVGSPYYNILKRWIVEGVRSDTAKVKRVVRLEVLPAVPHVTLPGMTQKTLVIAHYPDGTTRDVTREAVLTSSLPEVAAVAPDGTITAARRGEAALLVRYEGTYATNGITVLGDRTGYKWVKAPDFNYIDALVDKKLQKIRALPAGLCDDATYLRRVSIDLTGLPPTPEQVRAFLADRTPTQQKRAKLVDKLIGSPEFVERWTNKWADLLDANSKYLGESGVRKFRAWIRSSVAANKPYDRFVREMLTATGDAYENPAANYLRVVHDTSTATESITQLFLGVRFSCAKCHDHPFERWTQNQYYQLGAFFAQVGYKSGDAQGDEVVFNKGEGEVTHPRTGKVVAPQVPVGHLARTASLADRRAAFAQWLTAPDNPYFSRAMVNRLWSYFLGRGIIDPVDDIRASNPPSNPELLEALNQDFVSHGFDLRHMMRVIVLSRAYQSSIKTNKWNEDDKANFSHFIPRRLEAEQLLDAINLATGTRSKFEGLPSGARAAQLPDAVSGGEGFLDLFGRPARETPCECERSSAVSLGQALNLINGPTVTDAIHSPEGRVAQLVKTVPSDSKLVEEIFLAALSRLPTAREMNTALQTIKQAGSRADGAQDLMWALINSPAFLFNR
ncbi:MAG TPA: DUF1549 and DUF1553 domain-containing protein [Chthonomonadaceae bacterium]|nr:DUF1549 and DUF1553 domain-containing protein [Chthonomonadaceae bacterium]